MEGMATPVAIEELVQKPTWKEILYELIETRRLDPWNVDILMLAEGFLKKIREMKALELAVPANVILAASILLRCKSQALVIVEPAAELLPEAENFIPEELPSLTLASRLLPKRQITLDELVQEMEKSIRYEGERTPKMRGGIETIIELPMAEIDMEKKMEETYGRLKTLKDEEGLVLFSRLTGKNNASHIIPLLLALLHLTQNQRIDLWQDTFFGEIFIRVMEGKKADKVAENQQN